MPIAATNNAAVTPERSSVTRRQSYRRHWQKPLTLLAAGGRRSNSFRRGPRLHFTKGTPRDVE